MSASTASQHTTTGSHTRLTRRGRVLLLALLVAVLFGAFSLGRSASQAAPPSAAATQQQRVTVQAGDSLWSLAQQVAPDRDPRDVVARIRDLNDLSSAHLSPGQQLVLPVAA